MKFEDLKNMYSAAQLSEGEEAYRSVSQLLQDAKEQHKQDFLRDKPEGDHEQSWRAFKGKNFEKLIRHIISEPIQSLGLEIVNGDKLERSKRLSRQLDTVKRNIAVNYGEFGLHLPDADIIIFNPGNSRVIAILSSKTSLRERIAQTGYWKLKLSENENTEHIKVYLITSDTDGDLTIKSPAKKHRAIAEIDLDGTYVLTEASLEESDKVKLFEDFVADFKQLIERSE